MKRLVILSLILCIEFSASAQSLVLDKVITIHQHNTTIEKVLDELRLVYGIKFSYVNNVIPLKARVNIQVKEKSLSFVLEEVFKNTDITYSLVKDHVVLKQSVAKYKENETLKLIKQPIIEENLASRNITIKDIEFKPYYSSPIEPALKLTGIEYLPVREDSVASESLKIEKETLSEGIELNRIAQVSILPSLSTNGVNNENSINTFSLNLIAGVAKGLEGLEVGLISNIENEDVKGGQFAGILNKVGGEAKGGQFAGIANINKGYTSGGQFAGLLNIVDENANLIQGSGLINFVGGAFNGGQFAGLININYGFTTGLQGAGLGNYVKNSVKAIQCGGLFNISGGIVKGGQIAGGINMAQEEVQGIQASGLINISKNCKGAQFAGVANFANGNVKGTQIAGIFNYASAVEGSQFGFINISDTLTGVGVGFLNIVRRGYNKFEITIDETQAINIAFKPGTQRIYNIFTLGIQPFAKNLRWRFGYGLGTDIPFSQTSSLSLDGIAYNITNSQFGIDALNLLTQIKVIYNYNFSSRVTVFLGPSFNVHIYDLDKENNISQAPKWSFDFDKEGNTGVKGWIGFSLGLRL